ncbi:MAG: cupin domain-containing protein [Deltaproteobacteria bacterium]|nr:cupin domain-containing protein [Deltaproteobacteria bacterium]
MKTPVRVEKPWGHEIIWAHTDRYVGKVLHIDRGHLLSRQYHEVKDETLYVMKGVLILELGPADKAKRTLVPAGRSFHVAPGTIHRFMSPDDEDCDLLETSTPELDDVVRLEDEYGREGTSAP